MIIRVDGLIVERSDAVACLTLDRPSRKNALSIALRDAVSDALDDIGSDESIKVVVVTGADGVFSAGFDLDEFADPGLQEELWRSSDRFHHAVLRCPVPTIAAVEGVALAGGFDLACLCDIRVASRTASFGHPEHAWATVLYRALKDLVGGAAARDIVLTGRSVDAAEAVRIGLVAELVEPGGALESACRRAALVARAPRDALVTTKSKVIASSGIPAELGTLEI